MSRIKKQLEICPPAYMCKGPNRENFVSTGHKCGYCKGNGWFWGTEEGSREDVHASSSPLPPHTGQDTCT
ncbi:hypothetical protein PZH41_23290, partial [Phocaeicola vulgatus]|uniref:hypothetical protein n=1 Tax=Phocaeicola vulgatus TaxID=821 RepID=UPI0023B1CA09